MTQLRKTLKGLAGMAWPGRRTFSQFGEDVFIGNFFAGSDRGVWLDIGAFHPRVASNTKALRRRGWHGLNVDADSDKVRLFRWFRRRDTNVCAAVAGPGAGRAVLHQAAAGSYGSMDKIQLTADGDGLPTRTVEQILDGAGVTKVDFVSIDVEGLEPDILRGFPFERADVDLFCVEVLDPTLDGVRGSPVTEILADAGYQIVGWHPPSVFFAREPQRTAVRTARPPRAGS